MQCPKCDSLEYKKDGKTKSGTQRHKCKSCGIKWTGNPVGRPSLKPETLSLEKTVIRTYPKRSA